MLGGAHLFIDVNVFFLKDNFAAQIKKKEAKFIFMWNRSMNLVSCTSYSMTQRPTWL